MCSSRDLFSGTVLQKCGRDIRHQLFFGLWLVSRAFQHPAIQTKIEQNFGGFFHKIKVRQPTGRKDSKQTEIPKAEGWIHSCMKRLRTLNSYQIFNIKNKKYKKPLAVDVLFKAYPMVPLSCRSNLAGRYL